MPTEPPTYASVSRRIVDWFEGVERDLPWRTDPTPWRVLVSETMLQQTRVSVVVPRYEPFMERFPDPSAMAGAKEEDVLALWSGLGYYRRARSLHAAAKKIVELHGGSVPSELRDLRDLPGVGAYTAGAVLSIAFGRAEPIVDGNVERVLSRAYAVEGNVKKGAAKKRIWEIAGEVVAEGPPERVNPGMMELGALICTPRSPRCADCPLTGLCLAERRGLQERLPEIPKPRETVEVQLAVALVRTGKGTLLTRAPTGGFLAGTWAPPFARVEDGSDPASSLAAAAWGLGIELEVGPHEGTLRHSITHHRIRAHCFRSSLTGPLPETEIAFVSEAELAGYGLSSLAMKCIRIRARNEISA